MSDHEAARLRALYEYAVLDTPPEPNFDRITDIAANAFGMPVCTMSLADADRHWFKSHHGVAARAVEPEGVLDGAAHLLGQPEPQRLPVDRRDDLHGHQRQRNEGAEQGGRGEGAAAAGSGRPFWPLGITKIALRA